MTLFKFLKDKRSILLIWLLFICLTCLILWLTPSVHFSWEAILYLFILQSLVLIVYLTLSFLKKKAWFQQLSEQEVTLAEPEYFEFQTLSEEHKLIANYLENLMTQQQAVLEQQINAQQEQRDFIDSWVHEIKVPLASIKLITETIEDDIAERQFYQLENNMLKIESYVDQVLYYSRLDSFSRDYLIQESSLKQIIQPVIRQNANYFIEHNLHYAIEGPDFEVLTDKKWLAFILNQIISNAIKYTPDNGHITLELSQNERGTWLKISDTGIGIALEDQRRVFDKGFTGQNGRNQTHRSTGLGLYLAKSLAKKLGHPLYLESIVDKGTTVSLLFPKLAYYTDGTEEKLL